MIEANKGGPFTKLIDAYIGRKVRGAFRSVSVRGQLPTAEGGLLVYLNHSSFWDGFVVHQLGKQAGWDVYAMMEEANLSRYRFHARIGAFGVDKTDPRGALPSLRYAKKLLARPRAAVCIFPEGKLYPGGQALGPLQRGLEVLARSAGVQSVAVAVRYAFLEHEYPDVLLDVGEPHAPLPLEGYRQQLEQLVARGRGATNLEGYRVLVRGRSGVQERWDAVRQLEAGRPSGGEARRDSREPGAERARGDGQAAAGREGHGQQSGVVRESGAARERNGSGSAAVRERDGAGRQREGQAQEPGAARDRAVQEQQRDSLVRMRSSQDGAGGSSA